MRDKSKDDIFLRNFFKEELSFFTLDQPATPEIYLRGHGFATSRWYPLKWEIDTYPTLSSSMRKDLNKLFDLAETYAYLACDDKPFRSPKMAQKWEEIRQLAKIIYRSAQSSGLLNPSSLIIL